MANPQASPAKTIRTVSGKESKRAVKMRAKDTPQAAKIHLGEYQKPHLRGRASSNRGRSTAVCAFTQLGSPEI